MYFILLWIIIHTWLLNKVWIYKFFTYIILAIFYKYFCFWVKCSKNARRLLATTWNVSNITAWFLEKRQWRVIRYSNLFSLAASIEDKIWNGEKLYQALDKCLHKNHYFNGKTIPYCSSLNGTFWYTMHNRIIRVAKIVIIFCWKKFINTADSTGIICYKY